MTTATSSLEARYRRRAAALVKIARWPAIGALIGGGALLVGRLVGPSLAGELGARAGEGFARGVADAQEKIAQVRRQLSIGGWGEAETPADRALLEQLRRLPGLVSRGLAVQNPGEPPSRWIFAYEVRWLRGQPLPRLPRRLGGYPVKLVIVDSYPAARLR